MEGESKKDAVGIRKEAEDPTTTGAPYDAAYFANFKPVSYARNEYWLSFFGRIAEEVVRSFRPRRVLDAGCAMGLLVEGLRDRGVDAYGVDVSPYAIAQVRRDIRSFCRVSGLDEPIEGRFDLVTCIEVCEHIPEPALGAAIENICSITDVILFSSTPSDYDEPTHVSVKPSLEWLRLFAQQGFQPDLLYDASFVAAHAFVLRRGAERVPEDALWLFCRVLEYRKRMLVEHYAERAALAKQVENAAGIVSGLEDDKRKLEKELARFKSCYVRVQIDSASKNRALAEKVKRLEEIGGELETKHLSSDRERELEREVSALRREVDLAGAELSTMTSSIGWRAVTAYRAWLRHAIWGRPWLRRCYEPAARKILSLTLRRRASRRESTAVGIVSEAGPQSSRTGRAGVDGEPILVWDDPTENARVTGELTIRGWSAAPNGVERVALYWQGEEVCSTGCSVPRPDVASQHPQFRGSPEFGFELFWKMPKEGSGEQSLELVATSKRGERTTIRRGLMVDTRSAYEIWIEENEPSPQQRRRLQVQCEQFSSTPEISIVTPVYKTDPVLLSRCIESVQRQIYPYWQLCLVDDGSGDPELLSLLNKHAKSDRRIQVRTLSQNTGIASATNVALDMASGEYVGFLDHDDELADFALFEIADVLNRNSSVDLVYSDEDKIDLFANRYEPFFKPQFSLELLESYNYICHFLVCRRTIVEAVGGLRVGFEGSQDYDLVLRLLENSNRVHHVPKVLYHWRSTAGSTARGAEAKPQASDAGRRALEEHVARVGVKGDIVETAPLRYRVQYNIDNPPSVAIIIPTGGRMDRLIPTLESLFAKTAYENYEVLLVDNSSGNAVEKLVRRTSSSGGEVRYLDFKGIPFNFSSLCNQAVEHTKAHLLLFLNDDVSVISPQWLNAMVEHGQRDGIGAVGAKLLYANGLIQHAGVILGVFDNCGHAFRETDPDESAYFDFPSVIRNVLAVTGACLLTPREVFRSEGGFNETDLPVAFQDVDYCLRLHEGGYRNVYTPFAELYHYEASTKPDDLKEPDTREVSYMRRVWSDYIANDPYYSTHLTRLNERYEIRLGRNLLNTP